jgi:hypothetical protein
MRKIILTRNSASMGDDARDNTLVIEVDENWKIGEILDEIARINYLPEINGGKATWSVAYERCIAVIAQEWDKPRIINPDFPTTDKEKNFSRLHFSYFAQIDPDQVCMTLFLYHTMHY